MSRLTKRNKKGKAVAKSVNYFSMLDKLASYEDAEDQGLLLRLPLPEGTQVYCIGSCGEICDDYSTDCEVCGEHKVVFTTAFDRNMIEQFGKLVFAKEEEAEKALADMGV